jgi:3'(2'), 5'-bisphosphate nucleotidase
VGEESSADLRTPEGAATLESVTGFVRAAISGASADDVCAWVDRGTADPCERFWTLDPLDGTKGYLRGDQYVAALALIENGQVRLGVLGCPNLGVGCRPDVGGPGTLVLAVRGEGAAYAPMEGDGPWTPMRVSACDDVRQARLMRSFEAGHTNTGQIGQLAECLGVEAEPVRMDSQAKYAVMAVGGGELLFRLLSPKQPDYREKIWDQAAGSIVIEEAGGQVTDLAGKPLDFSKGRRLERNRGVVASNGLLHDAALEALARIGAA